MHRLAAISPRQRFSRVLRLVVIVPVALLLTLAGLLMAEVRYYVSAARWVERTDQVIARAHEIQRQVIDMETGVRGYLIAREDDFLDPYRDSASSLERNVAELGARLADDPEQLSRLRDVAARVAEWREYTRGVLARLAAGEPARDLVLTRGGKERMDLIRTSLTDFLRVEEGRRGARVARTTGVSRLVIVSTLAACLAFGLGLAVFFRRQLAFLSGQYEGALGELEASQSELEARVAERTVELSAANQELEAFSYSVSHDLRSPLRGIDGFSQALEEDYAGRLDETARGYIARIRAGAQRMGALIDDLLKLSRLTRTEMKREPVDLSELARRVIAGLPADRPVEWVVAPRAPVTGDPGLLQAVLENLMSNAYKFTSRREGARIEFGVEGEGVYFVRDNGVGFRMEYADKLFGAFQRLHGVREFPGTGIGLATVRRIVRRHGGQVWARAAEGRGATFYFTLGEAEPGIQGKAA